MCQFVNNFGDRERSNIPEEIGCVLKLQSYHSSKHWTQFPKLFLSLPSPPLRFFSPFEWQKFQFKTRLIILTVSLCMCTIGMWLMYFYTNIATKRKKITNKIADKVLKLLSRWFVKHFMSQRFWHRLTACVAIFLLFIVLFVVIF